MLCGFAVFYEVVCMVRIKRWKWHDSIPGRFSVRFSFLPSYPARKNELQQLIVLCLWDNKQIMLLLNIIYIIMENGS